MGYSGEQKGIHRLAGFTAWIQMHGRLVQDNGQRYYEQRRFHPSVQIFETPSSSNYVHLS